MKKKWLALFFTRNISLAYWVESGLFNREKLVYEKHIDTGNIQKVFMFTYGVNDKIIADRLQKEGHLYQDIEVVPMPRFFAYIFKGNWVYSFIIPLLHGSKIKKCDILKTNQIDGSWSAVIAKLMYKKTLVVRTGYTLSQLASKNKMFSGFKRVLIMKIESFAYKHADMAIVSSEHNKRYLLDKYKLNEADVKVQYNYIDTGLFKPMGQDKVKDRLLYVGRLSEEKNLFSLIGACGKSRMGLDLYGQGPLQAALKELAAEKSVDVNFMGLVSNQELVKIYNMYEYYILPSFSEGMPKTLLEAMACGCVCIGTNVDGINEVLDETKGYLAKNTDTISIAQAIVEAKDDNSKQSKREIALKFIHEKCSIDKYIENENNIFDKFLI